MSNPHSKQYTLEQRTCMVEHYFRTNSFKIALGQLFQKKFKERCQIWKQCNELSSDFKLCTPSKTNQDPEDHALFRRQIEQNWRNTWIRIQEQPRHTTQEFGHKCETVHTTLKEEGYFLYQNFSFTRIEARRLCSAIRLLFLVFWEIWPRCWNNDNDILHRRSVVSPFRLYQFKELSNMVKQ